MNDGYQPPDVAAVRAALRVCHGCAPEAAAVVERAFDALHKRADALQSADPFRALVLSLADALANANAIGREIRASILADLAEAERLREARLLLEAQRGEFTAATVRSVLTQPVALGVIGLLTAALTALVQLIGHGVSS